MSFIAIIQVCFILNTGFCTVLESPPQTFDSKQDCVSKMVLETQEHSFHEFALSKFTDKTIDPNSVMRTRISCVPSENIEQ